MISNVNLMITIERFRDLPSSTLEDFLLAYISKSKIEEMDPQLRDQLGYLLLHKISNGKIYSSLS
jgi:hypothetical protein